MADRGVLPAGKIIEPLLLFLFPFFPLSRVCRPLLIFLLERKNDHRRESVLTQKGGEVGNIGKCSIQYTESILFNIFDSRLEISVLCEISDFVFRRSFCYEKENYLAK